MVNLIYSPPPFVYVNALSLLPSCPFSSFPPSSSLFARERVNTPALSVSLMAPWKPVTPFFTDSRVGASVCVFMGGIRVLFGFKKQRRGHGRLYGPLAVIHVNSLKTTEALSS